MVCWHMLKRYTRLCVLVACATVAQLQAASAGPYKSTSPGKCKLVALGLNASCMVQLIATESGVGSKKYNMHAAVKDLLKSSEERGKVFERSMEKG